MNNSYISSRRKPHPSPRINVGSTIPCRLGALLLLGLVVFSLAGCDEAKKILDTLNITPPSENYGAFATSNQTIAWALGTGTTGSEAEADAVSRCASLGVVNCSGPGAFSSCGALALGTSVNSFAYFFHTGDTRVEAEAGAIQSCSRSGWPQCSIMTSRDGRNASYCPNE